MHVLRPRNAKWAPSILDLPTDSPLHLFSNGRDHGLGIAQGEDCGFPACLAPSCCPTLARCSHLAHVVASCLRNLRSSELRISVAWIHGHCHAVMALLPLTSYARPSECLGCARLLAGGVGLQATVCTSFPLSPLLIALMLALLTGHGTGFFWSRLNRAGNKTANTANGTNGDAEVMRAAPPSAVPAANTAALSEGPVLPAHTATTNVLHTGPP